MSRLASRVGWGWGVLSKQRRLCVGGPEEPCTLTQGGHLAMEAVGSGSIAPLRGFQGAVMRFAFLKMALAALEIGERRLGQTYIHLIYD